VDRYEERLRQVIEAKLKGEGIEPEPEEPRGDNVIDLMAALKRSLGQEGKRRNTASAKPSRRKSTSTAAKNTKRPAARKRA
jgi:DNA end-binding protein Ku